MATSKALRNRVELLFDEYSLADVFTVLVELEGRLIPETIAFSSTGTELIAAALGKLDADHRKDVLARFTAQPTVSKADVFAKMRGRLEEGVKTDEAEHPLQKLTLTTAQTFRLKGFADDTSTIQLNERPPIGSILRWSSAGTGWVLQVTGYEYQCGRESDLTVPVILRVTVQGAA